MDKVAKAETNQMCVFLWTVPRSVSTALTKCMSFVEDIQIWHEPYQYCHNNEKVATLTALPDLAEKHSLRLQQETPSIETIERGKMLDNNLFRYPWVKEQLETQDMDKRVVFVKDIAFLMHGREGFLPGSRPFRHTFLIREPRRVYPSLRKMLLPFIPETYKEVFDLSYLPHYDPEDIYRKTHGFWQHVKEHLDPDPIIIDSGDLTAHPEEMLPKYFDAIGVPYDEKYLNWDPSPDITREWKASYENFTLSNNSGTHDTATRSSRFEAERGEPAPMDELTPDVVRCIETSLPYYNEMFEQRIRP